jgi:tetratricopeptide (TPR) repeat protein
MLHHHCAGLVHLERARTAASQNARKFELDKAVTEHTYAAGYCPRSNPFWSNIEANLSVAYAEQGNLGKALLTLDEAVATHPGYDGSYIARSIVLKRAGKTGESRAALIEGSKATEQGSAELEYALGLSYFETREYEAARQHARIAYKLGYPLPGLMNRLAKAGFPL